MLLRLIFGNELEKMITSVINGFAREQQDREKQCGGAKAKHRTERPRNCSELTRYKKQRNSISLTQNADRQTNKRRLAGI